MKINVSLDVCEDTNMTDIEYEIIKESARQMINEVLNNRYDNHGKTFREKLHNEIKTMLTESIDIDFKESVKDDVVKDISKKYVRTKQYKEIKEHFEIDTDTIIKSGLKDIISDIVKNEIKGFFKHCK